MRQSHRSMRAQHSARESQSSHTHRFVHRKREQPRSMLARICCTRPSSKAPLQHRPPWSHHAAPATLHRPRCTGQSVVTLHPAAHTPSHHAAAAGAQQHRPECALTCSFSFLALAFALAAAALSCQGKRGGGRRGRRGGREVSREGGATIRSDGFGGSTAAGGRCKVYLGLGAGLGGRLGDGLLELPGDGLQVQVELLKRGGEVVMQRW